MPPASSAALLAAVARIVARAPSLADTLAQVAPALYAQVPFERLHLLRLDRADAVVLYSAGADGHVEVREHVIGDPATPSPGASDGGSSQVMATIAQASRIQGVVWLAGSARDLAIDAQDVVDTLADLLALAIDRDTQRLVEGRRRERIDALVRLLHTVAEALDVRHVVPQISDVVRDALPHDVMALTSWSDDGRSLRVYAVAGAEVSDPRWWEPIALSESDQGLLDRRPYVIHDVAAEVDPASVRGRLLDLVGARSALRVPIPLGNDVFGSLFFLARDTGRFSDQDLDFARRIADHLALALSHERLADAARRNAEAQEAAERLEARVATLTRELEARTGQRRVVGRSRAWQDVLAQAARVARTETTVLLTGESGTGKEVIARFLHHASRRREGPFVAINCAALPDQLLESELFGHERGAFTGAVSSKPGRIEQAAGGVLFLDEVGEMAPTVQAKLLRVLEEREFLRLGGTRLLRADIRVVAATNRDLHVAMESGAFREDLYYRLGVFEIALPPLRERTDDILDLSELFLKEIGDTVGRPAAGIDRDAQAHLRSYPWPGNVRELRNAIERAVILADGGVIRSEHLPVVGARAAAGESHDREPLVLVRDAPIPSSGVNLESIERQLVARALVQARYNKTRAARLLGLTRAQLYSRIDKYGLADPPLE